MKQSQIIFATMVLCIILILSPTAVADINISGATGILMDADTGAVLWGYNEHEKRAPASITKLVTVLLAVEHANMDDEVIISDTAVDTKGSIVWLRAGEMQTLENLIYACMLNSGNDAARAIAEHVGGSLDEFVEMMNSKAQELGAYNTHFKNPNGLPDEEHYSTAYDIAIITREVMSKPVLVEILGTKNREWKGRDWDSQLANLNDMLWRYEGTIGGKTGATTEAGQCLANIAERNGLKLIGVVLGSASRDRLWTDMTTVLNYGFDNFHKIDLVREGEEILQVKFSNKNLQVLASDSIKYLVSKDVGKIPVQRIQINDIKMPIAKGDKIGVLGFEDNGMIVGEVELVAGADFKEPITLMRVYLNITFILFGLFFLALLIKMFKSLQRRRTFRANRVRKTRYFND